MGTRLAEGIWSGPPSTRITHDLRQPGETVSCCDASQNPGDKHLRRATARSGPEWGCGLLFAPSKDRVPVFSREPHRVWTDSKSAHTDTHRHVSLSSPHAGFTSSRHTCMGAQHWGEPGATGRGEWAAFLLSLPRAWLCAHQPLPGPLCHRLRVLPCSGWPRVKHPLPAPHMQV